MAEMPPGARGAYDANLALRVEFPDLPDADWQEDTDGTWTARLGKIVFLAERSGLTVTHDVHGRIKQVPCK